MATDIGTSETTPPIFDGHNDLLFHLNRETVAVEQVLNGGAQTHIDFPRAKSGGLGGGMFAIFIPGQMDLSGFMAALETSDYDIPLPEELPWGESVRSAGKQLRMLKALENTGVVKICQDSDSLRATLFDEPMAALMHMEGAEAIDPGLEMLHVFFAAGLRSIGPVWSRPTIFGHGVPIRFPGSPDTGPGLTDLGKNLVRTCNDLGIVIDLSHLNEKGFDDVARISDAPLVATHSNAHALCPSPRNLTDRQLSLIAESGGVVGLNFAATFLREDGRMKASFGLDVMLRHIDYLITKLGEDGVALGSDFDGAVVSQDISDCAGLVTLRRAMREHGFSEALMEKLCWKNWISVLGRTLKP